jgi:hypothetical protein
VAAAVVDAAELAAGRLVLVEEGAGRPVERVGQDLGAGVARALGQLLEADGQREELAQAVPAQVVLLDQLLDVLGGRAAGAGLEQAAAAISGTTESILALVPSSRIGKRSVR